MEYGATGIDGSRGAFAFGNWTSSGSRPYSRIMNDMESQIRLLEQEAYASVLRAFHAQSDAITWETQSLMTELRTVLRVSNEEHAELLVRVNEDELIHRIREWRQAGGFSGPCKRQRQLQATYYLTPHIPTPGLPSQSIAVITKHPNSSDTEHGAEVGAKSSKIKSGQALPYSSLQVSNKSTSAVGDLPGDSLIGRKILTRWPEDNNFYEAVIANYNANEELHALVYDKGRENETWEWVDLKEILPEDIRWDVEDPGISYRFEQGLKRTGSISGVGIGKGSLNYKNETSLLSHNVEDILDFGDKGILTDDLIKEVERLLVASHPNLLEIKRSKKLLRDREQFLLEAISELPDTSDDEVEGEHPAEHAKEAINGHRGGTTTADAGVPAKLQKVTSSR